MSMNYSVYVGPYLKVDTDVLDKKRIDNVIFEDWDHDLYDSLCEGLGELRDMSDRYLYLIPNYFDLKVGYRFSQYDEPISIPIPINEESQLNEFKGSFKRKWELEFGEKGVEWLYGAVPCIS